MKTTSVPVVGRLRTVPVDGRDVTFVWSGDTAGQGWGISPEWGGMRLYEVMRRLEPDFFVHSGDMIYADGPLKAEVELPGGGKCVHLSAPTAAPGWGTADAFLPVTREWRSALRGGRLAGG